MRVLQDSPRIPLVLAAKVDGSSVPVAFPIELWHSPVGTQKGIRVVTDFMKPKKVVQQGILALMVLTLSKCSAIVHFFEVKAEDMA